MSNYLLKTGLNIRLADKSIDYNVVGSIVTFEEIDNEELRERFIKSFLEEGYIVKADGKEPAKIVEDEKPSDKEGETEADDSSDDDKSEDLDDFEADTEEEEDSSNKKTAKKATKVRGGKS